MVESRWLRWIGPGVVAIGAVGLVASATAGAAVRPWAPRACAGPPGAIAAAAGDARPADLGDLASVPWFRQDPVVDGAGELRGQRVAIGLDGDRLVRSMDLPAESFAAGPFGRIVLVGSDDGTASRLVAVDVAGGCSWPIAEERDVIRRATVDPTGTSIIEMRVDRVSRADHGIWLRPIDGRAGARRVLDPIADDGRFGRTWSTEFTWSLAGDRLAIQSCGEVACRTRIVPVDGAAVGSDRDAARRAGPRSPGRRGRRRRRDLRRVPRSPLPDRRHGPAKRWPAHARRRRGRGSPGRHAGWRATRPRGAHGDGPPAARATAR